MVDLHDETEFFLGGCRLDHDGCVVCADAGIPVRVVAVMGDDALCEDTGGNQAEIAIELVLPVNVGDVLVTHGGVAIGRVEESRSREVEKSTTTTGEASLAEGDAGVAPTDSVFSTPRLLDSSTTMETRR